MVFVASLPCGVGELADDLQMLRGPVWLAHVEKQVQLFPCEGEGGGAAKSNK